MPVRKRKYPNGHTVWIASIQVDHKRRSGNFENKKDAQEAESKWRLELAAGNWSHGNVPTFQAWAEQVIEDDVWGAGHKDADKTERIIRRLIEEFGRYRLNSISMHAVRQFLARIKREGYRGRPLSDGSVNRYRSWLFRVFSLAERNGIINFNPVRAADRRREQGRVRWLELNEIDDLIEVAAPALQPLIILATETGMRLGELLALDWSDVSWLTGEVTVRTETAKNSRTRFIPLTVRARSVLEELYQVGTEEGAVFRRRDGLPRTKFPYPLWQKALSDSGLADRKEERLRGLHFHDLRHSAGTAWLNAGMPLELVSTLLGHSSLAFTMERYAHVKREALQRAVRQYSRRAERGRNAAEGEKASQVVEGKFRANP